MLQFQIWKRNLRLHFEEFHHLRYTASIPVLLEMPYVFEVASSVVGALRNNCML